MVSAGVCVCMYVCVCMCVCVCVSAGVCGCVCVCVHMQVMRALYMALDKRLCVHDELRMASSRYCTTSDLEHTVWVNDPLIVRPAEVSVCAYMCVCCMCVCDCSVCIPGSLSYGPVPF